MSEGTMGHGRRSAVPDIARRAVLLLALAAGSSDALLAQPPEPSDFDIDTPDLVLTGVPFELEVTALDGNGEPLSSYQGVPNISGVQRIVPNGSENIREPFRQGRLSVANVVVDRSGSITVQVSDTGVTASASTRALPAVLSILPPLFAIALALLCRQVIVSLFAGVWLGAIFVFDYNIVGGFYRVLDHYIVNSAADKTNMQIVLFSMLFGGMAGIISRNGGAQGVAEVLTRLVRSARGGQLATWWMAIVLFFDDYSNVLIRGNLMRPLTDKLRVSREKLAFLVDTGAATVASVFLISTWIGYEVGLIEQGLRMIGSDQDAYSMFIRTIPYRFYPLFALALAFMIAYTGRDFGPMLRAERRARTSGKVLADDAQPVTDLSAELSSYGGADPSTARPRWYNGLGPIGVIVVVGLFGLYWTGTKALEAEAAVGYGIGDIVSAADSYVALLWASLSGCVVAMFLSLSQRILNLTQTMEAWFQGMRALLLAIAILILAWSIGSVTEDLHAAEYLVHLLRGNLSPFLLPALTFLIAAAMSFATGTSWATMAIMMPLVIPLAHALTVESGIDPARAETVLLGVVSSVLAGAVFGDHCSPISDTTVLSSMASACDHIHHVRTQLPYALLAAGVGVLIGDLPSAYGLPPWVSLIVGTAILAGTLYVLGKKVDPRPSM